MLLKNRPCLQTRTLQASFSSFSPSSSVGASLRYCSPQREVVSLCKLASVFSAARCLKMVGPWQKHWMWNLAERPATKNIWGPKQKRDLLRPKEMSGYRLCQSIAAKHIHTSRICPTLQHYRCVVFPSIDGRSILRKLRYHNKSISRDDHFRSKLNTR